MSRLLVVVALSLTACGGFGVIGNGKRVTQGREVPAFSTLEVHSAIELVATTGAPAVAVTTDENVMQYVEAFVSDGALVVRVRPGVDLMGFTPVKVTVSNDRFEGARVAGASTVTMPATTVGALPLESSGASTLLVTGVDSATVTLAASGSSTVKVDGKATTLTATITGASTVHAKPLAAETVTLSVDGASLVDVSASGAIAGHASGASTVETSGGGSVSVTSSGASTVTRGN